MNAPVPDASLPPRPRIVSPGRVVALLVALIGLYVVWPSIVAVFGSFEELRHVNPAWFVAMTALEVASFVCIWWLIGLCLRSSRYLLIGTTQLPKFAQDAFVSVESVAARSRAVPPSARRRSTACWSAAAWSRPGSRPG